MNRILLAYCRDNADLAHYLDHKLNRIGIPFEHVTDLPDTSTDAFSDYLRANKEPVLLLLTDNLLKNRHCMIGLLPAVQQLVREDRLLLVLSDGKDADGQPQPTHIDRMVNALQYMNHWQNIWLELSNAHQQASDAEKDALNQDLDQVRGIANQMGDLIAALRDAGYSTEAQLEANDFALFFQKFGLSDWHGQYRRLAALEQQAAQATGEGAPAVVTEVPALDGPLAPTPAEPMELPALPPDEPLEEPEQPAALAGGIDFSTPGLPAAEPQEQEMEVPAPDLDTAFEAAQKRAEMEITIRDAWFWLERGHTDRGLELFQLALEQYPEHEGLQQEYALALEKYSPPVEEASAEPEMLPALSPATEEFGSFDETFTDDPEVPAPEPSEARSYELMGEMAVEKGDYLFAKYCWDRAAELDPDYPDIYRKLGLMTSEHLRDYRETAVHYLQKALEVHPNDAEVHLALAKTSTQSGQPVQAEGWYQRAISIQPDLRTDEYDRQFSPAPLSAPSWSAEAPLDPVPADPAYLPQPLREPREVLTVLITGATSGIGRATAELFARQGHRLIVTGRRLERLLLLKTELETEQNTDVLMLPFDVRDPGAVEAALTNLPEGWQNVDILVNNAGLAKGFSPIQEGALDHWETMIDTNVKGVLYVTRAITPGMVERRRGHVINVGSIAGKEVYPNGNVYCATKFAVDALTQAMRLDLHQHNIRVSQVSPGHVEETEFALNRFDGDAERARVYDDFQPLRAADVAEVIYFMTTRPPHVNVQDVVMYGTQQASATVVDRSGRRF